MGITITFVTSLFEFKNLFDTPLAQTLKWKNFKIREAQAGKPAVAREWLRPIPRLALLRAQTLQAELAASVRRSL